MKYIVGGGLIVVIMASSAGFFVWRWFDTAIHTPRSPDTEETITFTVQPGESTASIGHRLEQENIITSARLFSWYLRFNPTISQGLQAGEFVIGPQQSIIQIVQELQTGTFVKRLTFIEGWRREQMAAYLTGEFGQPFADDFLRLTADKEGMLFPDTYLVDNTISPEQLVSLLTHTYQTKLPSGWESQVATIGMTEQQLLIFASILEREVFHEADRPVVAGILIKRWQNGWPLEADATVQYVMGSQRCQSSDKECNWWPQTIVVADLEMDSPYNTRRVAGLPPTPICNPGVAAIEAVLNYQETSFWFYLSDEAGTTYYAETLEEHNQNIVSYL